MAEKPIIVRGRNALLQPAVTQVLAMRQLLRSTDLAHVYGIPVTTFQDLYTFHPQIKLFFNKTFPPIAPGEPKLRVEGEITFDVKSETAATMTIDKAKAFAQTIKTKFITGNIFIWQKGTVIVTYLDKAKGYDFRLRVVNSGEGKKIIEAVMDIQAHAPDWDRMGVHTSEKVFPDLPSKEMIYGELRRPPRRRPIRNIPFSYAEMTLWGYPKGITLVDLTGRRVDPLITAA